jgi:hypothetical protein
MVDIIRKGERMKKRKEGRKEREEERERGRERKPQFLWMNLRH